MRTNDRAAERQIITKDTLDQEQHWSPANINFDQLLINHVGTEHKGGVQHSSGATYAQHNYNILVIIATNFLQTLLIIYFKKYHWSSSAIIC